MSEKNPTAKANSVLGYAHETEIVYTSKYLPVVCVFQLKYFDCFENMIARLARRVNLTSLVLHM